MISLKNITKTYGDKAIYNNFNLDITEGEITVILGESGCGKTTLLNIIANLTEFSGKVDLVNMPFSFIFATDRLVPFLTVSENLRLVNKNADILGILKMVNLLEKKDEKVKTLSKGMQRRVNIARALVSNAPLILMDEPFINLDLKLKYNLIESIKEFIKKENKTIVMVTHDILESVKFADRIILLTKLNKTVSVSYDTRDINESTEKTLINKILNS